MLFGGACSILGIPQSAHVLVYHFSRSPGDYLGTRPTHSLPTPEGASPTLPPLVTDMPVSAASTLQCSSSVLPSPLHVLYAPLFLFQSMKWKEEEWRQRDRWLGGCPSPHQPTVWVGWQLATWMGWPCYGMQSSDLSPQSYFWETAQRETEKPLFPSLMA